MYRWRNGLHGPISITHLRENVGFGELCISARKEVPPPPGDRQALSQGAQSAGWSQSHSPRWPAALVANNHTHSGSAGAGELSHNLVLFNVGQL